MGIGWSRECELSMKLYASQRKIDLYMPSHIRRGVGEEYYYTCKGCIQRKRTAKLLLQLLQTSAGNYCIIGVYKMHIHCSKVDEILADTQLTQVCKKWITLPLIMQEAQCADAMHNFCRLLL